MDYKGKHCFINKQGYYQISTGERRGRLLHRVLWEDHNNLEIPEGYTIHHKDHNKLNNDPANLVLMTRKNHGAIHAGESSGFSGRKHTEETKQKIREARLNQEDPRLGCKHSEETKQVMREKRAQQKMQPWTDERKEKVKATWEAKSPTTQEMIDDIVIHKMSLRKFKAKYNNEYKWYKIRKENRTEADLDIMTPKPKKKGFTK